MTQDKLCGKRPSACRNSEVWCLIQGFPTLKNSPLLRRTVSKFCCHHSLGLIAHGEKDGFHSVTWQAIEKGWRDWERKFRLLKRDTAGLMGTHKEIVQSPSTRDEAWIISLFLSHFFLPPLRLSSFLLSVIAFFFSLPSLAYYLVLRPSSQESVCLLGVRGSDQH